jgi:uncharacterized protein (DUF305 family)
MGKWILALAMIALIGCSRAGGPGRTAEHDGGDMMQQMATMNQRMVEHLGPADSLYDERFMLMMMPHHEGAILMAQDALQKARHPEVRTMAQDIIASQQREIDQMKRWRQEWYGR